MKKWASFDIDAHTVLVIPVVVVDGDVLISAMHSFSTDCDCQPFWLALSNGKMCCSHKDPDHYEKAKVM